jgi:hypothetical protein
MTLLSEFSSAVSVMKSESRYVIGLAIAVACILLIPLVGMQFTDEVNWTFSDFAAAWILLFGSGLLYRLISRRVNNFRFRAAVGLAVGTSLVITWANLAVGIIGNENNPANDLFFGVILIGFAGAVIARFRPEGLAITMFVMAFAQFLVPVIALMIWKPEIDFGVVKIIIFNGFFVMLYIVSALLFRNASRSNGDASST